MEFKQKEIKLKDGRTAIFRSPVPEDAEIMLNFFYQANRETPFLLNSPEDPAITVERELAFIENHNNSENDGMLVCLVDGEFAGNCQLSRKQSVRTYIEPRLASLYLKNSGILASAPPCSGK